MKTLGVKFQVAGVQQAQASLQGLKDSLNESLSSGKKALSDSLKARDRYFQNTVKLDAKFSANFNSQVHKQQKLTEVSPQVIKIRQQTSNLVSDIGRELVKEAVKSSVKSFLTPNKTANPTEYRRDNNSQGRAAVYQNSIYVRFTPEALRDLYGVFNGKPVAKDTDKRALYRLSNQKEGLLGKLINPIKSRMDYVTSGYFGSIGSHFGGQFAKGLDGVLDKELDISHERKGQIAGKTYAYFQNGKDENLRTKFEALKQAIVDLNDETQSVDAARIKNTIRAVMGIPNAMVDSVMTGFRRSSLEVEGVRKTGADRANFNEGESIENLGQYNNAIITASGFAGQQGTQGRLQAQRLREINQDGDTAVFSSDTPFTDVLFEAGDAVSGAAWGVNALANTANINLKGFNPDAVEMVNKVLAMREQNPEIEVTLSGHSAGGFVVEEAQYLLELLEVTGTRAVTVGTPNLKGGVKPQNIQRIFGENDPLRAIHDAAEYLDFVGEGTEIDTVSQGHYFDQYLASENVRNAIFRRAGRPVPPPPDTPPNNPPGESNDGAPDTAPNDPPGEVPSPPDTPPNNPPDEPRPAPRPSPPERAGLIAGELIVSILESDEDFASRAEIFRDVITEGFSQIGEDLNVYAVNFSETIRAYFEETFNNLNTAALVIFDLDSLDFAGVNGKFEELFRNTLLKPLGELIARYRRMALSTEAARRAVERSQVILQENRRGTGARVSSDTHTLIEAIGGYAGERGRSGAWVARSILRQLENREGIRIIPVANPSSDIDSESPGDYISSISRPRIRGYSPDSVEGAAEALAAIARNPEIRIKIVGYSGGSEIATEIVEILNSLGYGDRVEGIGIGAPRLPGGINPSNYTPILASGDPIAEQTRISGSESINNDRIDDHSLESYLPIQQVQNFLNGSPEPLDPEESATIANVSEDFLRNFALGLTPDEQQSDRAEATRLINLIEQFIPVSEADASVHLEEALENFNQFLRVTGNQHSASVEARQLLNEGVDFLDNPSDRSSAVVLRDRLSEQATNNRLGAREQNLNDEQFSVIDEELTRVIEQLNQFIERTDGQSTGERDRLVNAYSEHLQALKENATEKFKNYRSSETVEDFKQLNAGEKRQYVKEITELIKIRQRQYLNAVNNGQMAVAAKLGEELIEQTELVKQTFRNLAESVTDDDSLVNSIRGRQSYLTSFQNEIISGQPNLFSRVSQPLSELIGEQYDLADAGDNVASSLIDEIRSRLPNLTDIGSNIGEELIEGTEESLEIESPSKVFKRIGRFVVSGLREGLLGVEDPIEEAGEDIERSGEDIEQGLVATIKSMASSLIESIPILGKYKGAIIGIGTALLGMLGIKFAINNLQDLAKESLDTAMAVEALNRSILFVSRTPEAGLKNLQFISSAAKEISADLNVAKEAYAGFLGASKNTAIEGAQTDRIFAALAAAAANRGLDAQSQGRLFTAVEQIISKRYLGAEEVRGQIGDVFPGFEGILSEALGVESSQLSSMMQNRELGLDVLLKVAAVLEAQNAGAEGIQTAQMATTQLNNSLLEFKTLLGSLLQPLQKLTLNTLSSSVDALTNNLATLLKVLRNAIGVVLIALFGQVNVVTVAVNLLGKAVHGLILTFSRLWASKMVILTGLAKIAVAYALVAAAMKTVSNLIDLSKNQYQELNDDVDRLTASMGRYSQAIKDAAENQGKLNSSSGELRLNEGWELPDNWFGKALRPIVGGDRLNLDSLVRNRWNNMIDRMDAYNQLVSGGAAPKIKGRLTTEAERRQADFQVAVGDLNSRNDQLLMNAKPATDAAGRITELDRQIAELQSKRLELLPGDKEGLEASLAAEREINTQRDKDLKILTNYQQSLSAASATNKKALEELESGYANGEFEKNVYESTKAALLNREEANADKLEEINGILSEVTKTLSEFQRQLRNSNERIANFIERRGLSAVRERTEIITEGIELSEGDRVIQLKLEAASRREISDYISELEKTIAQSTKRLESGALSEGYRLVRESAETNGLTLDSATIDRMLAEEERSQSEKDALGELKALRENKVKLGQYSEQLAQNLQTNRNSLIDFNRTVSDYFFRINQQISEAQIEIERIVNQIIQTNIRNKLQAALSPNANSFVNQLIQSTQSLLDQAASYAEKLLGQRTARIQLQGQQRSLQIELQDFARNVGGASEALLLFESRLRRTRDLRSPQVRESSVSSGSSSNIPPVDPPMLSGRASDEVSDNATGNTFADKTKQIAQRLGIDPHALMTIMLFESAGTLNPKIQGLNVPGQGRGRGLIQFMPATALGLGTSDAELASMTDIEQLDYVEKYFAQFKGNFGPGKLENLYAAVLAGHPMNVNASDGYTTAREGAKTMMRDFGERARKLLTEEDATHEVAERVRSDRTARPTTPQFPIASFTTDTAKITSGYGMRRIFGRDDFHEGIDVAVSGGTKVVATNSGTVRHIKPLADQAQVGIETAEGVMEWFIHLGQNLKVKKGDRIERGQTIGYVAHTTQTARNAKVSTGDHLDYRVKVDGEWVDPMKFLAQPQNGRQVSATSPQRPLVAQASKLTAELTDKQNTQLDLQDLLIQNQEKESLDIAIANSLKSDRQKIDFNIVDSQFATDKLLDAGKDLVAQYDFQTADTEAGKAIRAVNTAFSDRGLQISREIIKYVDEINAIDELIFTAPKQIRDLRSQDRNTEADILEEKAAQSRLLLASYQEILNSLTTEYGNVVEAADAALKYVNAQNDLKKEQERLNKRSLIVNRTATVAEQRGTIEAKRKVKVHQEDLRLALKINELRQQNNSGEYLDSLIAGEVRQSQIATDNINYDFLLQELDLEKKLLDYQDQIDSKSATDLSRYGFDLKSNKLKKDNAIAQENLRFERELIELRKQYAEQPELLEELTRRATKLNSVNLRSIENEFKSLGKTIEDNFISSTQNFFSQFVSSGFDFTAQREKAVLEERLRYAEQLNSLENQHREEPGKLAHLKNRARELNEEKLDKIRNEFNLFSRTVDLAKQAVAEFIKQLAAMVAKQAAAKFISSVLGGAIGGESSGGGVAAVGNDYGSGESSVAAFTADKGMTVSDRKISDRNTSILRRAFPGISSAWSDEGSDAQLGVFHTGEELLSRKTGEAGRYQMLKRDLGINPLDKILNYSEGGTIPDVGSNILSGIPSSRPRIDLTGIEGRRQKAEGRSNKTINLSQTIYAQDADSFRLNEDQRNQDLVERLRRGI